MSDYMLLGARLALLFHIGCVILSHPKLYERVQHIRIFRIMGKIGGADYNDKQKKSR